MYVPPLFFVLCQEVCEFVPGFLIVGRKEVFELPDGCEQLLIALIERFERRGDRRAALAAAVIVCLRSSIFSDLEFKIVLYTHKKSSSIDEQGSRIFFSGRCITKELIEFTLVLVERVAFRI